MPYLVDGHNLIPKVPGIHLHEMDDEQKLIELLQKYCRLNRKEVEVFFDNASPGQAGVRKYGAVKANFVRQGKTADRAIQERLLTLKNAARNWIVVSSDHAVQSAARASHASVLSSDEFAREIAASREASAPDAGQQDDPAITPDELDDWLSLFGARPR
jgi:predicted RNA-binding protein with PIN domain